MLALHSGSALVLWNADTGSRVWRKLLGAPALADLLSFSINPFEPNQLALLAAPSSEASNSGYSADRTLQLQSYVAIVDDLAITRPPTAAPNRFILVHPSAHTAAASSKRLSTRADKTSASEAAAKSARDSSKLVVNVSTKSDPKASPLQAAEQLSPSSAAQQASPIPRPTEAKETGSSAKGGGGLLGFGLPGKKMLSSTTKGAFKKMSGLFASGHQQAAPARPAGSAASSPEYSSVAYRASAIRSDGGSGSKENNDQQLLVDTNPSSPEPSESLSASVDGFEVVMTQSTDSSSENNHKSAEDVFSTSTIESDTPTATSLQSPESENAPPLNLSAMSAASGIAIAADVKAARADQHMSPERQRELELNEDLARSPLLVRWNERTHARLAELVGGSDKAPLGLVGAFGEHCQQVLFHRHLRHQLVLVFAREVLLVDMFLQRTLAWIQLDRMAPSFLHVHSLSMEDAFLCLHENGSLSFRRRAALAVPPAPAAAAPAERSSSPSRSSSPDPTTTRQSSIASNYFVQPYEMLGSSEPLRHFSVSKSQSRHSFFVADPLDEHELYLLMLDGRLCHWQVVPSHNPFAPSKPLSLPLPLTLKLKAKPKRSQSHLLLAGLHQSISPLVTVISVCKLPPDAELTGSGGSSSIPAAAAVPNNEQLAALGTSHGHVQIVELEHKKARASS